MYQPGFTPFFPAAWNAAGQTKWVSYAYASGMEISLNDGERVSRLFAKITYDPATQKAAFEKLSDRLEGDDIQGVKPLPKNILDILKTGPEVEQILLKTKTRAELSAENAPKVRAFYQLWQKYNGVIYRQIVAEHREFDDWVSGKTS